MGFLKQMKDMKNMVHEAPGLISQSTELAANAQAMAAAQQASIPGAMPTTFSTGPGFEPIANVSLELYVEISQSFAEVGYDQTKGHELAARKGVAAADWDAAVSGWNARISSDRTVASRFNALYTGR